ncbi:hypothetical protein AGLY_013022 [Aphis glycines]|uniref:Uncharacterized protein n=1 Tax=Aphis glycines TaxID=307491 RepID=A0A6G0T7I5_APHGL|nr:hypothetical protein AGLY_013022 [Aphis glycines]
MRGYDEDNDVEVYVGVKVRGWRCARRQQNRYLNPTQNDGYALGGYNTAIATVADLEINVTIKIMYSTHRSHATHAEHSRRIRHRSVDLNSLQSERRTDKIYFNVGLSVTSVTVQKHFLGSTTHKKRAQTCVQHKHRAFAKITLQHYCVLGSNIIIVQNRQYSRPWGYNNIRLLAHREISRDNIPEMQISGRASSDSYFILPFWQKLGLSKKKHNLRTIKPRDDEKIDRFTDYILNNYVDNDVSQSDPPMFGWTLFWEYIGLIPTYIKLRSKAKRPCKEILEKNILREQTNKYINNNLTHFWRLLCQPQRGGLSWVTLIG